MENEQLWKETISVFTNQSSRSRGVPKRDKRQNKFMKKKREIEKNYIQRERGKKDSLSFNQPH